MEREHRLDLFRATQFVYPPGDGQLDSGTAFAALAGWGHTFGISTVQGRGVKGWVKSKWCAAEWEDKRTCFLVGGVQFTGGEISGTLWVVGTGWIVIPWLLEEGSAIINFPLHVVLSCLFSFYSSSVVIPRGTSDVRKWNLRRIRSGVVGREVIFKGVGDGAWQAWCPGFSGSASAWSERRVLILDSLLPSSIRSSISSSKIKDKKSSSSKHPSSRLLMLSWVSTLDVRQYLLDHIGVTKPSGGSQRCYCHILARTPLFYQNIDFCARLAWIRCRVMPSQVLFPT